jgi:integrase
MQSGTADKRIVYRITDEYALVRQHRSPMLYLEWREQGKPERRSTGCRELEPAKQRARELILEHAQIVDAKPEDVPLVAMIERYYLRHGKTLASKDTAKRGLALWGEYFPATDTVASLSTTRQREFLTWLVDRGLSKAYARRILGVGKAALNRAWHDNEIRQVPFVRLPAIGAGYPYYADFEQLVGFLNAPMPAHLFTYCMIRLNTGCRGDAARDLRPFQVDWRRGLVDLNPPGREQTKKFRPIVPLTDFLRAYLASLPPADCYVNWHGHQVASIRTTWRQVRDDAKLPAWFAPRVLRHTVGTELRMRGVGGWDVSGQLGHKKGESAPVTENYAKFDPSYLKAAKTAFDTWMQELAAVVPRMRDETAMKLPSQIMAGTRTTGSAESRVVAGSPPGQPVVGGTGFEPVTPTMSRLRKLTLVRDLG